MISEVYNEDNMIGMARYPDKFFELAIVDPEYGINVAARKHFGRRSHSKAIHSKTGSGYNVKRNNYSPKNWDKSPPSEAYFIELKRIATHQIIWGWDYFNLDWGNGLIKWNKLQPDNVSFGTYEYAFCSLLDREIEFTYLWAGMMQGKSLSDPTTQQGNKKLNEKRIHPTQKPVALYKWLLKNYAKPGDKILDTNMGSQSSRIAAYQMGFDYYGWELDKEYFDDGNKRFNNYKNQLTLFSPQNIQQ